MSPSHLPDPSRVARTRRSRRILRWAAQCGAALVLVSCVPSETSGLREVDDGSDRVGTTVVAPTFPGDGEVTTAMVLEGLAYDLTSRPRDQDYWSLLADQAQCAAEAIVEGIGSDRIVELGYRPGTPGAAINDLDLTDDERGVLATGVAECVDPVESFAALLYGDGRMSPAAATCVARGLGDEAIRALFDAWAAGRAVDPFEGRFATQLMGHAQVCIDPEDFNWPALRLPDDDPLVDSDAPAGSPRSPYVDDRRAESDTEPTTTTTAPPASTTTSTPVDTTTAPADTTTAPADPQA